MRLHTSPFKGRILLLGLTALAVSATIAGTMTSLALFTDQADVTDNSFSTGTIDISTSPTSALFAVSDMLPGDVAGPSALTVSNAGSVSLDYTMSTAADNDDTLSLRDQLSLVIKTKDTDTAGCANWNGTQLYSGTLASGALTSRTLASSGSEVLCFRVDLDSTTGNVYQGAATTAIFTFSATQ